MDVEVAADQRIEKESSISLPFPKAAWGRVVYAAYVTVLPAVAFWGIGLSRPEWQSGHFSAYLALFLSSEVSLVFFFLLAYSVICYSFLLISPTRFSQSFFIRSGIYTGTLLALQYSILALMYFLNEFIVVVILIWIAPLVFPVIYRWAAARGTSDTINTILFILTALVLAGIASIWATGGLVAVLMVLTVSAPFWSFLIAIRATIWLLKNYETKFNLTRGLGLVTWFAAYAVAWRYDILKMVELYAALPKQPPPDCYIATAAARGHPRFVQAWSVQRMDGTSMRVNAQLQRLKCVELALMAVDPPLHAFLRRLYDMVGKRLARRLQNPFLADMAYLLLKPCEWFAGFLLKRVIPEIDSISKKMYT